MKKGILFCLFFISSQAFILAQESDMVLVPAGEFLMGKNTQGKSDWQPEHTVKVDSFYMDRYEVTNSQYEKYCRETGSPLPMFWGMDEFRCGPDYPDYPVVGVNFIDAIKYARWCGKRLPTEAEWEYAARGGLPDSNYPWGNTIDSTMANYGRKYTSSVKVGSFSPNEFGLYDMGGNVWEWVMDVYGENYYAESNSDNPKGPDSGRFRVIRGGSWHSGAMCIQTYFRNGLPASWVDFAVGFRCVKEL